MSRNQSLSLQLCADDCVRISRLSLDQRAPEGRFRRCVRAYNVRVSRGGRDGARWLLLP